MGGTLAPLFYHQPLEIVRGEGTWLDRRRRAAATSTPTTTWRWSDTRIRRSFKPCSRQLAAVNTHSRYLHPDVVELAERLLATMPAELDTCLFTTSGTEANDLAWRMATAYTGGNVAAIVADHAYHGSSHWLADLSPNEWPPGHRPAARRHLHRTRGRWTGTVSRRRGSPHRRRRAAESVTPATDPALVLADLGFTSAGHPRRLTGFRREVSSTAHHDAGALFLADEVQSGFGRSGPQLWRFAASRRSPRTSSPSASRWAPAIPIGAVITRREIADALAARLRVLLHLRRDTGGSGRRPGRPGRSRHRAVGAPRGTNRKPTSGMGWPTCPSTQRDSARYGEWG